MYVHVTSPDKYSQAHLVLRHSTASVYSTNREQMLGRPRNKATSIADTVLTHYCKVIEGWPICYIQ